jgi:hypothetical protein
MSNERRNKNGKCKLNKGFDSMVDAKKYKDAKDLIERLTPNDYWVHSYKIQQIFYKSFVQDEKKSWKDFVSA